MPDPCAEVDPTVHCNPAQVLSEGPPVDPTSGVPLGQVSLEQSPHPLRGLRASLTFRIPAQLAPGRYYVRTCEAPCEPDRQASSEWPWGIYIGVDPPAGEVVSSHGGE